ncbi:MAG: hypothetical protein ABI844_06115 [Saprospiraceae bacterium]
MSYFIRIFILFILIITELLASTYWTLWLPMDTCRYIHLISGLGISALLFFPKAYSKIRIPKLSRWVPVLIAVLLLVWSALKLNSLILHEPLDFTHADMLPVIKVMCERWLHAEKIYQIIPEIWSGVMPVYLPAMYLPFIPAVIFSFDMRWITYGIMLAIFFFIFFRNKSNAISWLTFLFIGLWFDFVLHKRTESLTLSEEGVVYGYYMLLAWALYHKKTIWVGISAACCLLSRYSALFFIIGLLVSYFLIERRTKAMDKVYFTFFAGIILMTIGKAWSAIPGFVSLPASYLDNILANNSKYQEVLNDGLGMMPIIGINSAPLVQKIQLGLLLITAISMIYFVRKCKSEFYFLAFLKLSLVLFFNFLVLPYNYLFYTSTWVSFVIFFLFTNHPGSLNEVITE